MTDSTAQCIREAGAGSSNLLTPTISYIHEPPFRPELSNTYEISAENSLNFVSPEISGVKTWCEDDFLPPEYFPELSQRFWQTVDRDPYWDQRYCWNWTGGANAKGYGRFKVGQRLMSPHRVAWILSFGPIPFIDEYHGAVVMHKCDNPRCCRPTHLYLGTQQDNVDDMMNKGRHQFLPTGESKRRRSEKQLAITKSTVDPKTLSKKVIEQIRRSKLSDFYWGNRLGLSIKDVKNIRRGETV